MAYPGGKNGAGVYQAIINQMPPHRVYIEPFAGSGAILRRKRPADVTIAIDRDAGVGRYFSDRPGVTFVCGDGIQHLASYPFRGDELVYCDPPYVMAARISARPIYRYELGDLDHVRLLDVIARLPCLVMISGYASDLYARRLAGWRLVTFPAITRGGSVATEHLWCNFPEPTALHDWRYLGKDFRERERIKRKAARWRANFEALPPLERQAVLSEMLDRASSPAASRDLAMVDHASPEPAIGPRAATAAPGDRIAPPPAAMLQGPRAGSDDTGRRASSGAAM